MVWTTFKCLVWLGHIQKWFTTKKVYFLFDGIWREILYAWSISHSVALFSPKIFSIFSLSLLPSSLRSNLILGIWHLKTDLALKAFWQELTHKVSNKKGQTINPRRESYYRVTLQRNNHSLTVMGFNISSQNTFTDKFLKQRQSLKRDMRPSAAAVFIVCSHKLA